MKIPRYWARETKTVQDTQGRTATFSCWQWSDVSVADAQQKAGARAEKLAWKLLNNQKLERYGYGVRPLREEIREGITNKQHQELGIVTRNAYGALILNAANAMFIDIDFAPQRGGLLNIVQRLFGKAPESQEIRYMQEIELWAERHPEVGLRIYRTYGGLRCLVMNEVLDPTQESALEMMRALQCDPLYLKLCRNQASFRARLTPKPWRCGVSKPPSRYPWEDKEAELRYREWEERYARAASEFTVCRLVKHLGSREVHPDVELIKAFHDKVACSGLDLKLA